jgi:protein-S-isoprenylcysteine O-methyltransferase Ste14
VPFGFVSAALFVLLAKPRPLTLLIGAVVSLFGLGLRAWASGYIRKNDYLATSGPYAHTRNPLYLGSFLLGLGFTVASARWILAFIFAGLFLSIYLPVMRVEASTLAELFGGNYQDYANRVPLFFPQFGRYHDERNSATHFDAQLYLRYREYRAALGLLIAWGLLAFKAYYLR